MDRRVAQGRSPLASPNSYPSSTFVTVVGAACLVAIALVVYTVSHPDRYYNHFTWQAMAFLEGQAAIRYPVPPAGASLGNAFFQDVLPVASSDGVARALVPFPPLPAVLLLPFVALWGLATNGQLIFAVLGALDVGLAWWALGYLPVRTVGPRGRERVLRLRDGLLVRRPARDDVVPGPCPGGRPGLPGDRRRPARGPRGGVPRRRAGAGRGRRRTRERRPRVGHGLERARGHAASPGSFRTAARSSPAFLFGLACTSRLTVVFAAPFFLFVGGGGWWLRRGWSAALGAGIPLAALAVYNLVTTGSLLHPGYQHLYELEAAFYQPLNYHIDWGIEDIRYLPQNFAIMFLNTPVSCRTSSRRPWARAGRSARAPTPSAACSTPTARCSCRATPA